MKILLPGPTFPDSFVDNVRHSLEAMGHEVRLLPAARQSAVSSALRLVRQRILSQSPTSYEREIHSVAASFKPDILLATTAEIHPSILERLGTICLRVLWWGDAPANNPRWGMLDPGWDHVFVKDPDAVGKLRTVGRNAHLLHEAMNPAWHKPVGHDRRDAIAVVGNAYAYRQALVSRMLADGFDVDFYGPPPPRWSNPDILLIHKRQYIVREEKSRVFHSAFAALNSFSLAEGNSLNCRAFEIAGAEGLQIIEDRPLIRECFEPEKELLPYSSYEQLTEQLRRARRGGPEIDAIRAAAGRRARGEHTYKHRLRAILAAL